MSILRFAFPFILLLAACNTSRNSIRISVDESPQVQFALEEIKTALTTDGKEIILVELGKAEISIEVIADLEGIEPEGFRLEREKNQIRVLATDEAGAMYGGLELAEQIHIYGIQGVKETGQNPYMEMRGTKFNIPLDVRSPSYTDMSDVAQVNIPEMWSMDFWKEYIDNLARYRYNFISLWNLHPFPSMVKVPGYEDVALDDVHRSTYKDFKEYYSNDAIGLSPPEIVANPEIVKEISIEKKIEFWKEVMSYGKSRNVDFYIMTWNIFLNGVNEEYGMTEDIWNETTKDYFRKSVKEMFLTYPDLSGIGVTVGENMRDAYELKEDWIYDTYAEGVIDAAKEMPERNITFIHRQHMTGAPEIIEKFRPIEKVGNVDFLFSFKYAVAHVMSATKQYRHQQFVEDITAENMKTIWTLRNDDTYYFRWGAPDFVREFIQNIPYEVSRGYYYGSDQWVWGREFTTKDVEGERQLEIVKHWYNWMMWGRLGYNPDLDNDRFIDLLEIRFPETDALKLFEAWQEASMIYPVTTGFHWGAADYMWYIEGCKSRPQFTPNETGFHDVNHFIDLPPHKRSGYQSIPDFVKMTMEGGSTDLKNPLQVAELLHGHVNKALSILESLSAGRNAELERTLHDIRTMSSLGKYYAHKIAGSAQLALYRGTKEKEYQEAAIMELKMAHEAWKEFTENGMKQNINPIWTNRVGNVDWIKTTEWVKKDIEIASEK
jgi:hypothetical protein